MQTEKSAKIGIFDSGFGGLTVMRRIRALLPHENIVYFGDTARLPYGNKSQETVLRYVQESSQFLLEQKIKILVIACHTACALALSELQKEFPIPIVGVIPAAIESLEHLPKHDSIAVLATRSTISSGVYQAEIAKKLPRSKIFAIACPLFVPLVEEGFIDHMLTELAIREYLSPLKKEKIDALLLGCTHYPLLESALKKECSKETTLIDPALSCAESVRLLLDKNALLNPQKRTPDYTFYVSDDPEKFRLLGKTFLSYPIEHVLSKPV